MKMCIRFFLSVVMALLLFSGCCQSRLRASHGYHVSGERLMKSIQSVVSLSMSMDFDHLSDSNNDVDLLSYLLSEPNDDVTKKNHKVGSGVVISRRGHILTANHVVEDAASGEILVTFYNGERRAAEVIIADPRTDVALLRVDASDIVVLPMSFWSDTLVGEPVYVIGDYLGMGVSITHGIISAKNRSLSGSDIQGFIQVDAPVAKGGSGGALMNLNGQLVGMLSTIAAGSEKDIGIGFAIPTHLIRSTLRLIEEECK